MDFEALIRDEQDGLTRRLARVLGGDQQAAEDLRQEALVRAWRTLPRDADPDGQRAWLNRTARNLAIDELRRRSRRPSLGLDEASEAAVEGVEEPDAAREALACLDTHERFLILLRFDAGFAYADIGHLLAISEEAARKRVSRARTAFVKHYRAARAQPQPLILLVARHESPDPYVRWLERAGARVRVSQTGPTERQLALADGLVLTGAFDDVHSELYGERPRALRGAPNLERDRVDMAAVATAVAIDLPFVGICRGHQLMNVACGGSLYQDVVLDGATTNSHDVGLHRLESAKGSTLRSLIGHGADVHSEHHQAIRRLGRKLRVAGRAYDGLVETIEHAERGFALGLQWHPETVIGPAGARVAEGFLDAAERRAA
jgi:putative glutamine amidotransferase